MWAGQNKRKVRIMAVSAKPSVTDAGRIDTSCVDFDTMSRELGGGFFYLRQSIDLAQTPLDSIESAQKVCEVLVGRNNDREGLQTPLWKKARAAWFALSEAEIVSANDLTSARLALARLPKGLRSGETFATTAIEKCLSFATTYDEIEEVIEVGRSIGLLGYGDMWVTLWDKMFSCAKTVEHYKRLYESVLSGGDADKRYKSAAKQGLERVFKEAITADRESAMAILAGGIPYETMSEFMGILIRELKWSEAELRAYTKEHWHNQKDLSEVVCRRLDEILFVEVTAAEGKASLEALKERCSGLYRSNSLLQEKLDKILLNSSFKEAKMFEDFLTIFRSTADDDLRGDCWQKMKGLVVSAEQAEELWATCPDWNRKDKSEAHDLWLKLAGDERVLVEKVFEKTWSQASYEKLLGFVEDLDGALDTWGLVRRDSHHKGLSDLGFTKVIEMITNVIEVLGLFTQSEYERLPDNVKSAILVKALEVAKTKTEIILVARSIQKPDLEMHAAVVRRLAPFYTKAEAASIKA